MNRRKFIGTAVSIAGATVAGCSDSNQTQSESTSAATSTPMPTKPKTSQPAPETTSGGLSNVMDVKGGDTSPEAGMDGIRRGLSYIETVRDYLVEHMSEDDVGLTYSTGLDTTDEMARQIGEIVALYAGGVEKGYTYGSMYVVVQDVSGNDIGEWYVLREWAEAYVNGSQSSDWLIQRVGETIESYS